jgi:hypothetical protein
LTSAFFENWIFTSSWVRRASSSDCRTAPVSPWCPTCTLTSRWCACARR